MGSDDVSPNLRFAISISIHAPRVGSDSRGEPVTQRGSNFNPRSPCGERHPSSTYTPIPGSLFQSTLPVWGATGSDRGVAIRYGISIHAPRVGSDPRPGSGRCNSFDISIHAPRVGSDEVDQKILAWQSHFNPRSPCGERPEGAPALSIKLKFQSTLPVWGATNRSVRKPTHHQISIHAPRVGSDHNELLDVLLRQFQSTLPVWGATLLPFAPKPSRIFQSTLPVWGATNYTVNELLAGDISIHAPRVGSDSSRSCPWQEI